MDLRRFFRNVGSPLMLAATLALTGCGQSTPPSTGNAGPHEGDGHDHGAKVAGTHDHSSWWCAEHGVPEGECSQCNAKIAADFQKNGDWCKEHDRAHSQCFLCNPKAKEKYVAMYKAKYGENPPPLEGEVTPGEFKSNS